MKIKFLGLSAFLIESENGETILLDPFNDQPEYQLGASLPNGIKPDLVLSSHDDPDHCNNSIVSQKPVLLNKSQLISVDSLEFNGDPFTINSLLIDGLRVVHFADQSTLLDDDQLAALGKIDIAIYPAPKIDGEKMPEILEITKENIIKINAKVVIWSHFIVPVGWKEAGNLRKFFIQYLKKNASTNKNYQGEDSFIELCYSLENAMKLNDFFMGTIINKNIAEISDLIREDIKSIVLIPED